MSRGPEAIVVASFTKAAAIEIAGRKLPIPRQNIGTLHALCYRSLGCPLIAESKEIISQWNAKAYPDERINDTLEIDMDSIMSRSEKLQDDMGNMPMAYNSYRNQMIPRNLWGDPVLRFAKKWEAFKKDTNSIDFTDMIENVLEQGIPLPKQIEVGFFDEVQDFTKLELSLVRHWAERLESIILAGDDDQAIYLFRGATPRAFLEPPIDEEFKRVLGQSWRLPRSVKKFSDAWIHAVKHREPKSYLPRDEDGSVGELGCSYEQTDDVLSTAQTFTKMGKSVMILASCSYMLEPLIHAMKDNGILFYNPYRVSRGDWNPMRGGVERMRAFIATIGPWLKENPTQEQGTWEAANKWIELLDTKTSGLRRGGKKMVEELSTGEHTKKTDVNTPALRTVFDESTIQGKAALHALVESGDSKTAMEWLMSASLKRGKDLFAYATNVVNHHGIPALMSMPKIVVGTIHSVKGGQSDAVIVFPDLSEKGKKLMRFGTIEEQESVIRMFYVAFTRAKETLRYGQQSVGRFGQRQKFQPLF
jgi:DNA helicase-2/ATP-dependent DNA helicase PcrA